MKQQFAAELDVVKAMSHCGGPKNSLLYIE
jgi:hypothetical protein